jgi:hypothetical protein
MSNSGCRPGRVVFITKTVAEKSHKVKRLDSPFEIKGLRDGG